MGSQRLTTEWSSMQYSIVHICHNFFIQLSINRHLAWFHVLAIIGTAVMNTLGYMCFLNYGFSESMPSSGIIGSYGSFIPSF